MPPRHPFSIVAGYPIRFLFLLTVALLLVACSDDTQEKADTPATQMSGNIFGTFFQITLVGEFPEEKQQALQEGVMNALNRVDQQMSTYREDSDLNRLNNADPGTWVELPDDLLYVLDQSKQIAEKTDGAFDVTIGALVNLWTFGPEARPQERPDDDELAARLALTGPDQLELDRESGQARLLTDVFVDLGGIAKGYAVDAVADFLRDQGIEHFLVNIGGDMIARGQRTPDRPWQIGVEVPRDARQEAQHIVPLNDISLATSGDYRNYFEADGQRYSHTIDPRTGEPVQHNLASVSVFTPTNTEADGLATAFMVMGVEDTLSYAEEHGIAVLLIERHRNRFRTRISPALEALLDDEWLAPIKDATH